MTGIGFAALGVNPQRSVHGIVARELAGRDVQPA